MDWHARAGQVAGCKQMCGAKVALPTLSTQGPQHFFMTCHIHRHGCSQTLTHLLNHTALHHLLHKLADSNVLWLILTHVHLQPQTRTTSSGNPAAGCLYAMLARCNALHTSSSWLLHLHPGCCAVLTSTM
eukprot:1158632-Pelagomonas_calceolata.AAC.2